MGFDLLRDFWESMKGLDVAGVDVTKLPRQEIDDEVLVPMVRALRTATAHVDLFPIADLRKKTHAIIPRGEFCVTLDRRVYFTEADYELDLTRVASNIGQTGSQYFVRRPRRQQHSLPAQLHTLRTELSARKPSARAKSSRQPRIVLADDGISTGETIVIVISECRKLGIEVDRVVVCCNNTPLRQLSGVAVQSIVPSKTSRPWLNERDLYWGLPRTGLSFAPDPDLEQVYGIPFTINTQLVQQRIGIEVRVERFRENCLRINRVLWNIFERAAGGPLSCESCPPLRFVPTVADRRNLRVIDLLDELIAGEAGIELDEMTHAPAPKTVSPGFG